MDFLYIRAQIEKMAGQITADAFGKLKSPQDLGVSIETEGKNLTEGLPTVGVFLTETDNL